MGVSRLDLIPLSQCMALLAAVRWPPRDVRCGAAAVSGQPHRAGQGMALHDPSARCATCCCSESLCGMCALKQASTSDGLLDFFLRHVPACCMFGFPVGWLSSCAPAPLVLPAPCEIFSCGRSTIT